MPDDRLERFGMRGDGLRIGGRNDDACIRGPGGKAAVPTQDSDTFAPDGLGVFRRGDQIRLICSALPPPTRQG